jgi:prophage regulatory protein
MDNSEKIIRLGTVKARCGLSRSTIYLRIASGDFPTPVRLGPKSIGFVESEITAWIYARIEASRNTARIIKSRAATRNSEER